MYGNKATKPNNMNKNLISLQKETHNDYIMKDTIFKKKKKKKKKKSNVFQYKVQIVCNVSVIF